MAIDNPYQRMLDSRAPTRFLGSQQGLHWLLDTISREQPISFPLLGLKGMGKTSLLRYVADPRGALQQERAHLLGRFKDHPERIFPVLVEYSGKVQGEDPFVYLALRLVEQYEAFQKRSPPTLELPAHLPLGSLPQADGAVDQVVKGMRASLEMLNRQRFVRPVLLLDDFHLPFKEKIDPMRLTNMLSWRTDVSFILATEEPLPDPSLASSSIFDRLRYLSPLNEEEARRLIVEPDREEAQRLAGLASEKADGPRKRPKEEGSKGRLPGPDIDYLLCLTGSQSRIDPEVRRRCDKVQPVEGNPCFHPYLVLVAARTLWDLRKGLELLDRTEDALSPENQKMLFRMLSDASHREFRRQLRSLGDEEKELLAALPPRGLTRIPEEQVSALTRLENKALVVYSPERQRWQPFCALLRRYLHAKEQPAPEAPDRKSLTDQEEALLAYLRQTPNRIRSVEDLLRNVWNETGEVDASARARVQSAISRLKSKLGEATARQIASYRSRGYCYRPEPSPEEETDREGA